MNKPSEDLVRIAHAVEEAEENFWASIAASYPEATTGDFPPELTIEMDAKLKDFVTYWVKFNVDAVE